MQSALPTVYAHGPMPRPRRALPRDYLASGTWPDGLLLDDAPAEARLAQILSKRLSTLIRRDKLAVNALATEAELTPQTIHNLLKGVSWPDLVTVSKLEVAVGQRLWINKELGESVENHSPRKFYERHGSATLIGFVDTDTWRAEICPSGSDEGGWSWAAFVLLPEEGWTRDGKGTATDPDAAEQAVDAHIAERIAVDSA